VLAEEELYNTQNAFNLIANEGYAIEYLLASINSKLMTYYHKKKFLEEYKDRFQKILIKDCKEFPIKKNENQNNNASLRKQTSCFQKIKNCIKHLIISHNSYRQNIQSLKSTIN